MLSHPITTVKERNFHKITFTSKTKQKILKRKVINIWENKKL